MKRIYLCGPVSGRPVEEYTEHFSKIKAHLTERASMEDVDIEVISPSDFPCRNMPWEPAMKYCIKQLIDCDGIAVLQGWIRSRGALMELEIAGRLKIPVVYIEPPVDEFNIAEFSTQPIYSDVLRYYKNCYFKAEENTHTSERAGDIAMAETVNRYLDPHGFEYIDREEK